MATCKECLHVAVCGRYAATGGRVRDCEHWNHMEEGMGDCKSPRFRLDGHPDPTMYHDDYCSCGERKDNGAE